jgi:hypothetical protein
MVMLVVSLIMTSCYKDKGNYAYHTINDITTLTSSDTFSVTRLDTLRINPTIMGLDTGRVRYEWRVYPVADPAEPLGIGRIVVLSRQRNFNEPITLPAGSNYYSFDLVSIDTVTGVSYFKHLHLLVTTAFQTGWMLLEDNGNNGDISFITPENKVFHNVYSAANPDKPLPVTSHRLISLNNVGLLGSLTMVYFDTEGYTLDNTTMQVIGKYSSLFFSPPAVIQPQNLSKPSIFSYGPYTFSAGKIYALNGIYASTLFGAAFTQPDSLGYTVAPYVAGGLSYGGIFFDQAHYRFIYDGGSTSTSLKVFPANNTMAFDLNKVKKKMLTMKAGMGWDLWPDNWYAVFKNEGDDSCFLYTVNANGDMSANPVAAAKQAILNSPNVQRSPDYLFSSTVKQMYYAADNQLYVYDMAANQSRVIYQFPSGEMITALQMQNNIITVATYNGSSGGGTVYDLPISSTGDISGNAYTRKNGGFEKIVCLTFKVG